MALAASAMAHKEPESVVTATTYETTTVCPITNTVTYGGS